MKVETPPLIRDLKAMLVLVEQMMLSSPVPNIEEEASITIARVVPVMNGVEVMALSKVVALSAILRTLLDNMEAQIAAMPEPETADKGPNAG